MKKFSRTLAGKVLLFGICVIFSAVFLLSAAAAVIMIDGDYYHSNVEALVNAGMNQNFERMAMQIVFSEMVDNRQYGYAEYELRSSDGEQLSRQGNIEGKPLYVGYVQTYIDRDGQYSGISSSESQYGPNTFTVLIYSYDGPIENDPVMDMLIRFMYAQRYSVYAVLVVSFSVALLSFIVLMNACGKSSDGEELRPGILGVVPYDVQLFAGLCAAMIILPVVIEMSETSHVIITLLAVGFAVLLWISIVLLLLCGMAVQIKKHSLIKGSVTRKCIIFAVKIFRGFLRLIKSLWKFLLIGFARIPLVKKTALVTAGIFFLDYILIINAYNYRMRSLYIRNDLVLLIWMLERAALFAGIIYLALMLRRLQKGAKSIADGELSHVVDTDKMLPVLRSSAENLNSISVGMSRAVEERVKSERMKIELITNVSHDIKTPLTSILNYAALIGDEPTENRKITEYSQTLVAHSVRLKRLLDDLVEATKAGTGNLDVVLAPCSAQTFLAQASGEYQEKLESSGLTLITSQPEAEVFIMADGRRMSRIFDNLFNNICKYAMPGTRVYLNLRTEEDQAVIAFKNTSRDPLNISSDELMERFVRGDSSRNTEGSGLGLSIARSLTELQNGKLELTVDGDLFKIELCFPVLKQ